MQISKVEREMLDGKHGMATRKAMEILVALGAIYGAERLIPVSSVQIAGVSYDNLGEAGLEFLNEMAAGGGRARVLATLNPAGMDIENWEALGISPDFASQQERVLQAFERMQVITTCTCTPYLSGNLPRYGEHIAWAESSAVCFANSVLGARSNREGGPSALAAALTGRTPAYGYHLDASRLPNISVQIEAHIEGSQQFGALGKALGELLQPGSMPYLLGIHTASLEALKSLCASLATYGGVALFHIPGITPEAGQMLPPVEQLLITQAHLDAAIASLNEVGLPVDDGNSVEVDFVSLGCPHLTIREIARIAELLRGKQVKKEFWITTARPTKQIADRMGFTRIIETSGARIAADTCCVVAPIKGRFKAMATDSAKACYYAYAKNDFRTVFLPFDEVVKAALE